MFIQSLILPFLTSTRLSIFRYGAIIAALIFLPSYAIAKDNSIEFVVELDAYYSNIGVFIPFSDETEVPTVMEDKENGIYRKLISGIIKPSFLVFEASIYPMPLLGVYLKNERNSTYKSTHAYNVNLIESITTGFQEPAALTLFLGDVVTFCKQGETIDATNKGYLGYAASIGSKHIVNNTLVDDDWIEFEFKLKGDRKFTNEKLCWSFRIGGRRHGNPDISDTLYFGVRREHLSYVNTDRLLVDNASINFISEFNRKSGEFLRQEAILGKKYPIKDRNMAFSLDMGIIWESNGKYRGSLKNNDHDEFSFIVRPNIEF